MASRGARLVGSKGGAAPLELRLAQAELGGILDATNARLVQVGADDELVLSRLAGADGGEWGGRQRVTVDDGAEHPPVRVGAEPLL